MQISAVSQTMEPTALFEVIEGKREDPSPDRPSGDLLLGIGSGKRIRSDWSGRAVMKSEIQIRREQGIFSFFVYYYENVHIRSESSLSEKNYNAACA